MKSPAAHLLLLVLLLGLSTLAVGNTAKNIRVGLKTKWAGVPWHLQAGYVYTNLSG